MTIKQLELEMTEVKNMLRDLATRVGKLEGESVNLKELISRIGNCEAMGAGLEERLGVMDRGLVDMAGKTEACATKITDWERSWPALTKEEFTKVGPKKATKDKSQPQSTGQGICTTNRFSELSVEDDQLLTTKPSCEYMLRNTKDEILVIGDSLSRGAGYKLKS